MKKLTYLFVACMVSLVVASCGGGSNSSDADRIAQLEDSIKILNNKLQSNITSEIQGDEERSSYDPSSPTSSNGTYQFTDVEGTKWKLHINSDKTATLEGNGNIYYGSWYYSDGNPRVNFDETPHIGFPHSERLDSHYMTIIGEYIYGGDSGGTNSKAKNPRKRLSITK
ncbi:MAG: hypothetical protein K2O00_09080 [Muribaculaceae bacterium]|nr:hypothetical protein [Muribaculaceae bacterium]